MILLRRMLMSDFFPINFFEQIFPLSKKTTPFVSLVKFYASNEIIQSSSPDTFFLMYFDKFPSMRFY